MDEKPFSERAKLFSEGVKNLAEINKVAISIELTPINWVAKLSKRFLKIKWEYVLVNTEKTEKPSI